MKIKVEFLCTECHKYFDFKLNIELNGNIRVHCPNCGHIHFRKILNGEITDTRFTENHESIFLEDLYPSKASCRDYQKEKPVPIERIPLKNLWQELFSGNT